MTFEPLRPVVWSGELVALAGVERFHLIAPRLLRADAPTRELRYIALLCLYHRQILIGALPDRPDPTLPERWANAMLALHDAEDSKSDGQRDLPS
jgi:hypothetical protein